MLDIERTFIEGAARALWARALWVRTWADREENTCQVAKALPRPPGGSAPCGWDQDRRSFAGQKLEDIAPPTPDYVKLEAARLLGMIEQANGMRIASIVEAARSADMSCAGQQFTTDPMAYAQEFGWYLAMQAMGHGVSWEDDHAAINVPSRAGDCARCGLSADWTPHLMTAEECSARPNAPEGGCREPSDHHPFERALTPLVVPSFEFTSLNLED